MPDDIGAINYVPDDLQRRLSIVEAELRQLRGAVGKLGLSRQNGGRLNVPGGMLIGGGSGGGAGIVVPAVQPGFPIVVNVSVEPAPPGGIGFTLAYPANMGQESLQYWEVQTNIVATATDPGWISYTVNGLNFICPTPYSGTVYYRIRFVTNVGTFSGWVTGSISGITGIGGASIVSSTFTPSFNSTGGDAVLGGGSVRLGRYTLIGTMCIGWAFVGFGTGWTPGTGYAYEIGTPIPARIPFGLPTATPFGVSSLNCSSGVVHHGATWITPGAFGLGSVFLHGWDSDVGSGSSAFYPGDTPGLVVTSGGAGWLLGFAYETN